MLAFLRLIRLPNLLIIALTQYAMRYCIIQPVLKAANETLYTNYPSQIRNPHIMSLQLSNLDFFLLVLSTVMIAAAGYVINDYFDIKIDRVNKPERQIVDREIKRRVAMGAHVVINFIAVGLGAYVAIHIGNWKLAIVQFICAGGLWYYSTTFKQKFLAGNLLIAFFTALVPLAVGLYEIPLLVNKYRVLVEQFEVDFLFVFKMILAFSFFAFLTTLIREILKDMEDVEGDREYGCSTLPIVWGIGRSKFAVAFLIIVTVACLGYIQSIMLANNDSVSFWYISGAVQLPLLILLAVVLRGKEPKHFRPAQIFTKVIMLTGIFYSGLVYYYSL